jgi:hypothetical protein
MSRISALRSITFTSVIFSRLRTCAGERSSSNTISVAPFSAAIFLISSALPLPT